MTAGQARHRHSARLKETCPIPVVRLPHREAAVWETLASTVPDGKKAALLLPEPLALMAMSKSHGWRPCDCPARILQEDSTPQIVLELDLDELGVDSAARKALDYLPVQPLSRYVERFWFQGDIAGGQAAVEDVLGSSDNAWEVGIEQSVE